MYKELIITSMQVRQESTPSATLEKQPKTKCIKDTFLWYLYWKGFFSKEEKEEKKKGKKKKKIKEKKNKNQHHTLDRSNI